jgi:hypothetical protein
VDSQKYKTQKSRDILCLVFCVFCVFVYRNSLKTCTAFSCPRRLKSFFAGEWVRGATPVRQGLKVPAAAVPKLQNVDLDFLDDLFGTAEGLFGIST